MHHTLKKIQILSLFLTIVSVESYTPIVIWHGLANTCCNDTITGRMQKFLLDYLPGTHVLSLQIGDSPEEDFQNSVTMHPSKQIEIACNIIKSDPLLVNGYNAIGYSQGAQFFRGLAQRCPEPPIKNLITLAGQHQGIYGFLECEVFPVQFLCYFIRSIANSIVYSSFVQNLVTPAAYWHNPLNSKAYVKGSTFIADINNERSINQTYVKNLQSLETFVMVKYEFDDAVHPVESSWFGFYKDGQNKEVETLQESQLYISDRLGLKKMDADGRLHFLSAPWMHTQFEWPWFKENIVDKYLR